MYAGINPSNPFASGDEQSFSMADVIRRALNRLAFCSSARCSRRSLAVVQRRLQARTRSYVVGGHGGGNYPKGDSYKLEHTIWSRRLAPQPPTLGCTRKNSQKVRQTSQWPQFGMVVPNGERRRKNEMKKGLVTIICLLVAEFFGASSRSSDETHVAIITAVIATDCL